MSQADTTIAVPFRYEGTRPKSRLKRLRQVAAQKPLGTASLLVLVGIWAACLLAPLIAPYYHDALFVGPKLDGPRPRTCSGRTSRAATSSAGCSTAAESRSRSA